MKPIDKIRKINKNFLTGEAGSYSDVPTRTVGFWVERGLIIFEVVEYVHMFLVGTVLYITAIGLYQLFIQEIKFPNWLRVDSTEELETNLIGVTVVVLAVNFMGAVFVRGTEGLLDYGAGIALPIAALGLFIGLRAWSTKMSKETTIAEEERNTIEEGDPKEKDGHS